VVWSVDDRLGLDCVREAVRVEQEQTSRGSDSDWFRLDAAPDRLVTNPR